MNLGFNVKQLAVIAVIAAAISAGITYASNNVDAVEDTIG